MQEVFYKFAVEHLFLHIILISLAAGTIIVSMGVDMATGMKKSKKLGQEITSRRMGDTLIKAWDYFAPFTCLALLDLLASVISPFPLFSLACAGVCVYREFTSVREKSWQKQQIHDFDRTIKIAATDKADIAKLLMNIMGADKDPQTAPQQAVHDGERTINLSASDKADIAKLLADLLNGGNSSLEGSAPTTEHEDQEAPTEGESE